MGCGPRREPASPAFTSRRLATINRQDRFNRGGRDLGPRMNERIRITPVRVIGAEGEQLGILETSDALRQARAVGMDLVEVAPTAHPPVCRILDYGKYKYEEAKKQRETRKNSTTIDVKGIRLRPGIDQHDFDYRTEDARKFLQKKDKVQVTLIFRGREMAHPEIGEAQMKKMAEALSDVAIVERAPSIDGRRMTMLLSPK